MVMIFNISLSARWSETREREFTLRNTSGTTGVNIYGDFNVTGAPIMCVKGSGNTCDWTYNGNLYGSTGLYLNDFNTQKIALNSSSADLTIPSDAIITKAYLYWNGHIFGTDPTQYAAAIAGYNSVVLRTPDGINHTITANVNDATKVNFYAFINDGAGDQGFRHFYQATSDVTDIVNNGGFNAVSAKSFTVGNLNTTSGADAFIGDALFNWGSIKYGPMGGWSLIVEYVRPVASGQAYKNVAIYDGFKVLIPTTIQTTKSVDINLSGFLTPLTGIVKSSMAYFMMGAEKSLPYESAKIAKRNGTLQSLFNTLNPINNVFNDTVSIFGNHLNTTRQYNPGLDLDVYNLTNSCKDASNNTVACIETNQSSTHIQLTSRFDTSAGNGDQSFSGMVAFSTDIYSPDISTFRKDSNSTSTQKLLPGDRVEYTLDFNNSGSEAAEKITIYDTFSSTVGGDMLLNIIDRNSTALKNGIRLKSFSEANYHCAIGSTDPACASLLKDANCSVDYANNDVSKATKLWCYIPYMAVGDRYLMKFTAKVRDDYNQSSAEANVTNMAYSDYYNAATHEYISVTGQSNINTAGVVGGYVALPASGFDAREISIVEADNNRSITTKTVNKPFQLNVVSLDTGGAIAAYQGVNQNLVYLFAIDTNQCSVPNSTLLTLIYSLPKTNYVIFNKPDITKTSLNFNLANAGKDKKIALNYINWSKAFADASFNCSNSNADAVLLGVPQCLNDANKIEAVFGTTIKNTCALTGARPACQSNSYNSNNVPSAPYDNAYGCYQCLAGAAGAVTCSTDNFALRPDRFEFTAAGSMKSGEEYNLTVYAKDYTNTNTQDYNQSVSNLTGAPSKWWQRDTNVELNTATYPVHGAVTIAGDWNLSNGTGSVPVKFSDVGRFTLDVNDTNWAAVDIDDTALNDRTVHGEGNVTFIPWDFNISAGSIVNNNGTSPSFTYLSNDLNMSARIPITVSAQNKQGAVTVNYANNMYERSITITPSVSSAAAAARGLTPLTFGITNADANFTAGSTSIAFNDPIAARFNFSRDPKAAVSPFDVNSSNGIGSDVNISITDTDSVVGAKNQTLSSNATFVYGRVIPRDVRVFGNTASFSSSAWYEVYNAPSIGGVALTPSRNDPLWYTNRFHNDLSDGDANVTMVATGANPANATAVGGVETYSFGPMAFGGYKAHITAQSWLWYGLNASTYSNPGTDCLTHPCFNISVVPPMGCSGSTKSGSNDKTCKLTTKAQGLIYDYAPATR